MLAVRVRRRARVPARRPGQHPATDWGVTHKTSNANNTNNRCSKCAQHPRVVEPRQPKQIAEASLKTESKTDVAKSKATTKRALLSGAL